MTLKTKICCYFLLCIASLSFAQIADYNYKQNLENSTETWHSIPLTNPVFSTLKQDLSDIRIYGITSKNDTIEAPYILKINSEKIEDKIIPFNIINESKTDAGYYYTFQLDSELSINQIKLKFDTTNFDYNIQLEGSQNQNVWFTVLDNYRILSIKNQSTDYSFTTLAFKVAEYKYFRLFINTPINPKLKSANISKRSIKNGDYESYKSVYSSDPENTSNKTTVIDINLQSRVPVSKLDILVGNEFDYYRPFKVEYISDNIQTEKGTKYTYKTLTRGTLNSIELNDFKFESVLAKSLRLTIYNADNQPLNITDILVKGYKHHLIARFTEDADYSLVYGNNTARLPNYDIKTFENTIPVNLQSLVLGEQQSIQQPKDVKGSALFESKYWLWAVMIVIIILLGGFTLKMMKKN